VNDEQGVPASVPSATGDWWVGANDEYLSIGGPLETRDEAIARGRDYRAGYPFYITRAVLRKWTAPDAVSVMDHWVDAHEGLWYEDGFPGFEGPNMRERELAAETDLQAVLNEWFERHRDILPHPTAFAWTADGEWIDKPAQGIEAGTVETERLDPKDESPVAESDAPDA